MSDFRYVGSELELFEKAFHWKAYWRDQLLPYLHGAVLEVGAGIGANTPWLAGAPARWVCLEPDAALCQQLRRNVAGLPNVEVVSGTLADLGSAPSFDAILYLDVLEHIEEDRAELRNAAGRLRPGGSLIVLGPAHPWLFSPFDGAIGHHRRYTRASLRAIAPPDLAIALLRYLDAAGMLASLGNRLLLRRSMPSQAQILFWDQWLVPISRRVDGLLAHRVGRSILGIWRRPKGRG